MELPSKKIIEVAQRYIELEHELDDLKKEVELLHAEHELLRDILFAGYPTRETRQIIDILKQVDHDRFTPLIQEIRQEIDHREEMRQKHGTSLDEALLQKKQGCIICGQHKDASFSELADKGMVLRDEQGGGWICMDCFLSSEFDDEDEEDE